MVTEPARTGHAAPWRSMMSAAAPLIGPVAAHRVDEGSGNGGRVDSIHPQDALRPRLRGSTLRDRAPGGHFHVPATISYCKIRAGHQRNLTESVVGRALCIPLRAEFIEDVWIEVEAQAGLVVR